MFNIVNNKILIQSTTLSEKKELHDYDFTQEQKDEIVRLFGEKKGEGIERMESNNCVFRLKQAPQYVFKRFGVRTADHYEKVHQVAKKICFENQLDLLDVPKSALLDIDGPYIVEEYLDIYPDMV